MSGMLQLRNKNTSTVIELSSTKQIFIVQGREKQIKNANVSYEILRLFFQSDYRIITYSEIADIVRKYKSVSNDSDGEVSQRHVFNIRACLKDHGIDAFFSVIRTQGYSLDDSWVLTKAIDLDNDGFLKEIRAIVDSCLDYCDKTDLTSNATGLTYMHPDDGTLINNYMEIDRCYRKFIDEYARPGNSAKIWVVRDHLTSLLSFCIYWRVGDRLSEEQWKADYRGEITELYENIVHSISRFDS